MARRRKHPNTQRPRAPHSQRKTLPGEPGPLLVIDQTPILKKALTECRRLRTELDKKQARLRQFEEEEMPAYQRWYNAAFGAGLTELRTLQESLADYEFVAEQMGWCEMCRPDKLTEVFAELMRRMKDGTLHAFEPPRPEHDNPDEDEEEDEEDDDFDDIFDDMEEAFSEAFNSFFGSDDDNEEQEAYSNGRHGQGSRGRNSRSPEAMALKTLYRTLAKRLHPDHSDLEEKLRERRWNELQDAYHAHDLEVLQRIEAVCDMEDEGGLSIRLGLARLRDLAAYHRAHVRPIRNALRAAKRHPAFDFTKTDQTQLRREVEAELDEQRSQLRHRRDWLRDMFAQFAQDTAQSVATEKPADPEPPEEDDGDDFWDSYTAWRDEELSRAAGR